MFKKPVQFAGKKDLNRKESSAVGSILVSERLFESDKFGLLVEAKCSVPDSCNVILRKSDGEPLGFRHQNGTLFPSLYVLWEVKDAILPFVFVNSAVSSFVLSGANLMLPGVIRHPKLDPYGPFAKDDLVAIYVVGNPLPIALGKAEISSDGIMQASGGAKGKAISVMHYFGDGLWQLGSKTAPRGFSFDSVEPGTPTDELPAAVTSMAPIEAVGAVTKELSVTQEEMDELIVNSFYNAAKNLSEQDLPMNASALFSRVQLSAKRILESSACLRRIGLGGLSGASGLKLDIKASSHKTLTTLITHLGDRSLLTYKTVRNELVVTSIRFENPEIKSFVPPLAAAQESTNRTLVQVNTWYALNKPWTAVFPMAPAKGSRKDFADIIQGYLKESCKGTSMDLTDALRTALGSKDFTMEKREITKRFSESLVQLFSLSTELPPKIRKGVPPTITVTVKRIQGSKYATFVSGLSKYCLNEDELVQVMARAFSVSVSVGDSSIYCQGDLSNKILPWLVSVVGIPKECVVSK